MKLFRASLLVLSALALQAARGAAAPKFLGPNKCSSCHDHEKQKAWADQDKHGKALSQLEDKNAGKYAKAIGVADPYDLKGACVKCHATVFNGDANAGVSCETCHGAGSDYVDPHQTKGNYTKAVTLGMFDTRGNYPVWAKMCLDCHIVRDAKLVAAGHKSGADFEVGAASQKIVHWAPIYDFSKLTALGRGAASKAGGAATAKSAPKATPVPAAPAPPAAGKPTAPPAAEAAAPIKPTKAQPTRAASPAAGSQPTRQAPAATPLPTRIAEPSPAAVPRGAPGASVRESQPPGPARRWTPATREGITIQIQATPILTVTPLAPAARKRENPPVQTTRPPARRSSAARPHGPRPKRTAAAKQSPAASPTPTKVPAPLEPPRRPPH